MWSGWPPLVYNIASNTVVHKPTSDIILEIVASRSLRWTGYVAKTGRLGMHTELFTGKPLKNSRIRYQIEDVG
jgi:hypothetical protein